MIRLVDILDDTVRHARIEDTVSVRASDNPVIYTVPHAGTEVPRDLKEPWNLGRKALLDADLHTEKLYEFPDSTRLTTTLNRYVINMNRPRPHEDDVHSYEDEDAIRTFLKDMEPSWTEPLPDKWEQRLIEAYEEYHGLLEDHLARLRDRHGFVFLITCHSMNAEADSNTPDTGERPDISLCTEHGEAADDDVIDAMQRVFEQSRFEHRKNDPYAGGYTTNTYADPSVDIHGVQIEVNKSCYMDETTLEHNQLRAGDLKSVLQTAKKAGLAVLQNKYAKKKSGESKA